MYDGNLEFVSFSACMFVHSFLLIFCLFNWYELNTDKRAKTCRLNLILVHIFRKLKAKSILFLQNDLSNKFVNNTKYKRQKHLPVYT
jgi:hypothetical protein